MKSNNVKGYEIGVRFRGVESLKIDGVHYTPYVDLGVTSDSYETACTRVAALRAMFPNAEWRLVEVWE